MEQDILLTPSKVDTIFNIVKQGKDCIIVCGNNVVSAKKFKTPKAADDYIASKPYELFINTAITIFKTIQDNENNKENLANMQES